MGNDGGSIPTRRELVKSAARLPTVSELKATALEALTHAWQTDPVSSAPLDLGNAVSDWRGRLYNYETVLQGLLPHAGGADAGGAPKDRRPGDGGDELDALDAVGRDLAFADTGIRSVRDVVRLHGTPYKSAAAAATSAATSAVAAAAASSAATTTRWQCPVTLKELGPAARSVYLVPCGHVFSDAAVEAVLSDGLCPACSTGVTAANIVPILPTDKAELARLRQRIETLRAEGLTHSLKKDKSAAHGGDKKGKKHKRKAEAAGGGEDDDDRNAKRSSRARDAADGAPPPKKKRDKASSADAGGISSRINNPLTASLTAKVLAEQEALQKRRKLAESRG